MDKQTMDIAQWFATLGVGGVLAGFMFLMYRKDVKQYTELWKVQSEQLISVVRDNSSSNTKLVTVVEALHQRLDLMNRTEWEQQEKRGKA